jgi:protoporphyrinogen oxidase
MTDDTEPKARVAVLGGGMMGITTAREIAQSGAADVTLFEADERLGGLSMPYTWNGVTWDTFYHVILSTDTEMLEELRALGLEDELFFRETRSGFYGDGKLVSMAGMGDFLRFPFLSLWQKFRLGMGILLSTRVGNASKLDRIYVREWLTRMFGRRVYEQIWDPLLRSKLGSAREHTSAAFIWATIRRLYGAREGNSKVERMGHVHGGYRRILERERQMLDAAGVTVRTNARVDGVSGTDGTAPLRVEAAGSTEEFDRVVATLPAPEILRVVAAAGAEPSGTVRAHGAEDASTGTYWDHLGAVTYLGVVCVFLVLRRSLSPYYVINLLDKTLPFTGIIEATNVVSPEELSGHHLVYLPKYAVGDDAIWDRSDDEVRDEFLSALGRVFPDLDRSEVLHAAVFRRRYVQPLQDVDYLRRSVGYRTPIEGLYVVNTSMIYNSTLNNNAVVRLAREAAQTVAADIGSEVYV